ncbi:MAG: hypothetical protein WBQ76_03160 [Candidatus Korobacteraceae bacterium]
MNKAQRIILVIYCGLIAASCLWVPWHLSHGEDQYRAGYGWIWAGPRSKDVYPQTTVPDLRVIALQLAGITFASAAAFFVAKKSTHN